MSFDCRLDPPWLIAEFDQPQQMLSWSITSPGFVEARQVAWLQVRDRDLDFDTDPRQFLKDRLAASGISDAVAMMTSRDVQHHHQATRQRGEVSAHCLVTLGLNNGVHVASPGQLPDPSGPGTINILCNLDTGLSEAAMVEAVSVVTQARTAALLEATGGAVTGTGTDCIVLATPLNNGSSAYAGLHTDAGQACGQAVYQATLDAARRWLEDHDLPEAAKARSIRS